MPGGGDGQPVNFAVYVRLFSHTGHATFPVKIKAVTEKEAKEDALALFEIAINEGADVQIDTVTT